MFRMVLAVALATSAASITVDCTHAQTTPRTITLVVPFPAGGPTDTIGRIAADGLQSALGQPVIVENVPGATGSIGVGRVARAEADGHTLILGTVATHVFNGAAYELKYDVVKDFEPISLIAFDPQIIAVKKTLPVSDLLQLIKWLKENPDKAVAGTAWRGRCGTARHNASKELAFAFEICAGAIAGTNGREFRPGEIRDPGPQLPHTFSCPGPRISGSA